MPTNRAQLMAELITLYCKYACDNKYSVTLMDLGDFIKEHATRDERDTWLDSIEG